MKKLIEIFPKITLLIILMAGFFIKNTFAQVGPAIQGNHFPLPGSTEIYSVNLSGYTPCSLIWDVTNGVIINPIDGIVGTTSGISSITVEWNCSPGSGFVITANENWCYGNYNYYQWFYGIIQGIIPYADTISGEDSTCIGQTATYTAAFGANTASYSWSVTSGAGTIVSGQGSENVQILWSAVGDKVVTATPVTAQGCSGTAVKDTINVKNPSTLSFTDSTAVVCGGADSIQYTVTDDPSAVYYTWTLPVGVHISSGDSTNSIFVYFDPYAQSGNITAHSVYTCGEGFTVSTAVTVNVLPYPPTTIQGVLAVCDSTSTSYAIDAIPNASAYLWDVVGGNPTSDSTTIPNFNVTLNTPGAGSIIVTPVNSCGHSPTSDTLNVIVHPYTTVGIVDSVGLTDTALTALSSRTLLFNHCATSNGCANKIIDKATLLVTYNTGEIYNYGDNVFATSTSVRVIGYGGLNNTTPIIIDDTLNFLIDYNNPEQVFYLDFTDDYYTIQSFKIEILSYDADAVVENDIQLTAIYNEEFKYSALSVDPLVETVSVTQVSSSNQYEFSWTNSCTEFPSYEIQILRLYNIDPDNDTDSSVVSANINWNEALTIETQSSHDSIILTLAEGTGYYVWRVRPIGNYYEGGIGNDKNWGLWSDHSGYEQGETGVIPSSSPSYVIFYTQFNEDINWIYSRTFTEGNMFEDKQVRIGENISFANGLQQVKQTQVHLSTGNKILTTETVNDFSGRPALSSMPVPLDDKISLGLEPSFMKNAGDSIYTAEDFDGDDNFDNPEQVNDDSGEHFAYYSNNNTDSLIPNAENYPFTRTLFYNDGNSSVKEQSGVGSTFRIKSDLTNSRTNKTFYSGVADAELIRVFGDEAPYRESVHKVINIDGNRTASVTYIGKDGKTLATCLAINGSNTLDDNNEPLMGLESQGVASLNVADTINNNTPYGEYGNQATTSQTFLEQTEVNVYYDLTPKTVEDICLNYCVTCDYFVEIMVQNIVKPDTFELYHSILLPSNICDSTNFFQYDSTIVVSPGTYIFTKKVVANNTNPNTLTDTNTIGSTYYEMHLDSLKNTYDSLIYGSGGQLDTIYGYLDSANINGLYTYLGININVSNPDSVYQDSLAYITIGCDTLPIPIILCPIKQCPPDSTSFAQYFNDFWNNSPTFSSISGGYSNSEFDEMIENMRSDGYSCDSLWDCWYGTVHSYDEFVSMYNNPDLPNGIEFNIVDVFLDCAGRRIEGISTTDFGTPGYLSHAYSYFNYDGEDTLCEKYFVVRDGGSSYPNGSCEYPTFSCFEDSTWTQFYQCVRYTDPNSTSVAETDPYVSAQNLTDTCEKYCEEKKQGYIDAIVLAFHQKQLYVSANPEIDGIYPYDGDIYQLDYDSVLNRYQFNDTIVLDPDTIDFISWDEINCMANSLVKHCKEGCTLTPVFDTITGDTLLSMGTAEEIAAYQNSFTSAYEVYIPDPEESCDAGWDTISSGSYTTDTLITTNSIASKFYLNNEDYFELAVVTIDTNINIGGGYLQVCSQFDSTITVYTYVDTAYTDTVVYENTGYACDTITLCYEDWVKIYGGDGYEYNDDFGKTSDGGYLIVGNTNSDSTGIVYGNHGGYDAWLVKVNSEGGILWSRTYGGTGDDKLIDFKQTSQGDYVLAGYSSSDDGDVHSNAGGDDFWVLKINAVGDTIWSKSYGTSASEKLYGITLASSGIIVVGEKGGSQYRLKLDNNGDTVWTRTDATGILYAVTKAGGGNYAAVGYKASTTNHFIVKFDEDGDTLWTKTYGSSATQFARDVHYVNIDGQSRYLVSGLEVNDYSALMLDEQGNIIFSNTYGGSLADISGLSTPLGNGFILTGCSKSTDGDVHQASNYFNHWIAQTDWNGDTIFTLALDGGGTNASNYLLDYGVKTELNNDGCYLVAGNRHVDGVQDHRDIALTKVCPGGCCEHRDFCFRYVDWPTIPDSIPVILPITCEESAAKDIKNAIEHQVYEYTQNKLDDFKDSYLNTCVDPDSIDDTFVVSYPLGYHHYTLYYYNRAGSLIQTVPPQGVDLLDKDNDNDDYDVYVSGTLSRDTFPNHRFITDYEYNSLGQLIRQQTPDGDTTDFYYNNLGQLRFSQNAQQLLDTTYSYTKYDELGRIIEVGKSTQAAADGDFTLTVFIDSVVFPTDTAKNAEVTYTVYTDEASGITYLNDGITDQRFLQNRVSYTFTDEDANTSTTDDQTYTYYSYDPHGNVEWLVQDIPGYLNKQYVRYEYDLVSGNVLKVCYNENKIDQFYHRYSYDADNRIITAETSLNNMIWEKDAKYEYYAHGPLRRAEIGEDKIQGLDYVYTVHGWLKALNHGSLNKSLDPGKDGTNATNNFAKDVFAMQLNYFTGDFNRSGSVYAGSNDATLEPDTSRSLYNGNISTWTTNNLQHPLATGIQYPGLTGYQYRYDELNRIRVADFKENINLASSFNAVSAYGTNYRYDANGNIYNLNRKGTLANLAMDSLKYYYYDASGGYYDETSVPTLPTNKLAYVTDGVSGSSYADDLETQSSGNYDYDKIGNLIQDTEEEIEEIKWTVYGKVKEIIRTSSSSKPNLKFIYDASGNRIAKIVIPDPTNPLVNTTTWYSRDASGNVMAVYESESESSISGITEQIYLIEQPIYGSSRIGERKQRILLKTIKYPTEGSPTELSASTNAKVVEHTNMLIGVQKPHTVTKTLGYLSYITPQGGGKQEVNFSNPSSPQVDSVTAQIGFGIQGKNGCVVEDENGNVVFRAYTAKELAGAVTNVCRVLDTANNLMIIPLSNPIKSNFEGKSIGIKKPGSSTIYYLITVGTDTKPYYHEVNISTKEVSPNHAIDTTSGYGLGMALFDDLSGVAPSTLYLRKHNGNDTADIITVPITTSGFGTPTVATSFFSKDSAGVGEMQISADGTKLAIANQTKKMGWWANKGEILVYGLDVYHEILGQNNAIPTGDFTMLQSFDFSPLSKYIYYGQQNMVVELSGSKNGSKIIQLKLTNEDQTSVISNFKGEIRRAKDEKLYVAAHNQTNLKQISNSDAGYTVSNFTLSASPWKTTAGIPLQSHKILNFENPEDLITRELDLKTYQINDHLGNIRAVVYDRKLSTLDDTTGVPEDFVPEILMTSNYYAFGSVMPNRSFSSGDYRYGFNGKESDNEVSGNGNSYDYGFRIYNPRIGKFLSVDPLTREYAYLTPYQFASNMPIVAVDVDGLEADIKFEYAQSNSFIGGNGMDRDDKAAYQKSFDDIVTPMATSFLVGPILNEVFKGATALYRFYKTEKAVQKVVTAEQTLVKAEQGIEKAKSAYQMAREGGKHSGLIKTYADKTVKEIEKGADKLGKRFEEHLGYIKDPAKALADKKEATGTGKLWNEMTKVEQKGVVKYWKKEAANYSEQKEVLNGLAAEKSSTSAVSSGAN